LKIKLFLKAINIFVLFSILRRDWEISKNQKAIKTHFVPLYKIICNQHKTWRSCP